MQNGTPTPTRGVPITLDRERRLRFSFKTVREIQDTISKDALSGELRSDNIALLLWYGLKEDDPSLTLEQVEELLDLEMLPMLMEALLKAMGGQGKILAVSEKIQAPAPLNPPAAQPESQETPQVLEKI